MLIECPSCRSRAQIPDSKEGAKVRCGECGRVYVAAAAGQRGRRSSGGSSGLAIGLAVGVAALVAVVLVAKRGGGDDRPVVVAEEEPEDEPPARMIDMAGWESPTTQAAVALHTAAASYDLDRLARSLHGPRLWAERRPDAAEWPLVPAGERDAFLREVARELVEEPTPPPSDLDPESYEPLPEDGASLVAQWKPFDGEVVRETDDEAVVRLAVSPRDEGYEKRSIEWRLAREDGAWKAYGWERWLAPEERAALRKGRGRGYEIVELSDGSRVLEREPEPLGHLEDTPPELRARIDELYAKMIDLDLAAEGTRARTELEEIGKPAIPVLLTGLYEIPLDTHEQAIQVNVIDQALQQITGQDFGYKPMQLVGSMAGTTEERRQSAIRQWFAWWYRNQDRFEEKETADALEGKIELTEREKRFLERTGER